MADKEEVAAIIRHMEFRSSIRDEWEKKRHTYKKWEALRNIYAKMTPIIMEQCRTSPYFIDWDFTPIESDAWHSIRQLGLPMFPQYPIGRFFVDFGDPKKKIAIECDGRQFHNKEKDAKRDAELNGIGWKVFRFPGYALYKGEDDPEAAHHGIKDIWRHYYSCEIYADCQE